MHTKRIVLRLVVLILLLWVTSASSALAAAPADIFAINARLGRGINFGNALEANYEGQWGMWIKSDRGINHSEFLATVDAKSAYSSSSLVSA